MNTRTLPVWSDEPMTRKVRGTITELLKREGIKCELLELDEGKHTDQPVLVLGKIPDWISERSDVKTVTGPSGAVVMGHSAGMERMRRALRLWDMTVRGEIETPVINYSLVVPGTWDDCDPGEIPGKYLPVQNTVGHEYLVVDIEVSGDIRVDEPEDTDLISVAVLFWDGEKVTNNFVWTGAALHDPDCIAALVAVLTCGVPLLAHNAQFDFKWLNNHLKAAFQETKLREHWGAMYARTPLRIYPAHDTMILHYILYPGATGDHGLKDLAQKLRGAEEWEADLGKYTKGKAHYENIPQYVLYAYNAKDVWHTHDVFQLLMSWLAEKPAAAAAYKMVMSWIPMFIDVEDADAGWPIDVELGKAHETALTWRANELRSKVRKRVGDPIELLSTAAVTKRFRHDLFVADNPEKVRKDYILNRWLPVEVVEKTLVPRRTPVALDVEEQSFNPGSPLQVSKWLRSQGLEVASTDEKALNELLYQNPDNKKAAKFIAALLDYRHTTKMLGTYVSGVLNAVRNGRARPKYKVTGTLTGRLASTKPAIQTIPKKTPMRDADGQPVKDADGNKLFENWEFRGMWTVEPGELLVGVDYAQMETRCVAELCGDPQMIEDLQEGQEDFFALLMPGAFPNVFRSFKDVLRMEKDDPGQYGALRGRIKPFSHGVNYGRKARAIAMDLKMPLRQAEHIMHSYLSRYPELVHWQEETMSFVRGDRVDPTWGVPGLYTPFGRRFQAGVITQTNEFAVKNSALAFRPQSIGSDICVSAAHELHTQHLPQLNARLVGFIHDALMVITPEENAMAVKEIVSQIMTATATKLFTRVPFMVDAKIGKNWSQV